MLKESSFALLSAFEFERLAEERLRDVLKVIPFLVVQDPAPTVAATQVPDFTVELTSAGSSWTLVCEVKRLGQPRQVREAVYQLRRHLTFLPNKRAYGVLIASYLSEESISVLREESMGYLDLAGNCFLSFDSIFIERHGAPNPSVRRRTLRELFAPKASRVLRVLLQDLNKPWRVADLAESAGVSLGQASNVRRALLDREWARVDASGVRLKNPTAVLEAWGREYKAPVLCENHYYTLLHGAQLDTAIHSAFTSPGIDRHLLLASFSAAGWLAPFARVSSHFFYADPQGEQILKAALQLQSVPNGANIIVSRPKEDAVFMDRRQPAEGIWSTGPVQTYLDLAIAGDRGREAAGHLRRATLDPIWHAPP